MPAPPPIKHRNIDPLPRITFINDQGGADSPDQPVSDATARMIEAVVRQVGMTININSTTGGNHAPSSNHYRGKAVDIDRVDGLPVSADSDAVERLQEAFRAHPNIREHFGPFICEKTHHGITTPRPDMAARHTTHLHVSGQE